MGVGGTEGSSTVHHARESGQSRVDGVLLPRPNGQRSERLVDLALDIAEFNRRSLIILLAATGPNQIPADHPDSLTEEHREVAEQVHRVSTEHSTDAQVRGVVRVGRNRNTIIHRFVANHGVETLLIAAEDIRSGLAQLIPSHGPRIARSTETDVVMATGIGSLGDITSMLVPISGGPHSGLAIEVASAVAAENDAWIDLLHVIGEDADETEREQAEALLSVGLATLDDSEMTDTWVLEAPDVAEAISEQSRYYDVTVIGAPRKGRLRQFVFGSITGTVRRSARSAVLTTYRPDTDGSWTERRRGIDR